MCSKFQAISVSQPFAFNKQLIRCDVLLHKHRGAFSYQTKSCEATISVCPTRDKTFDVSYLFSKSVRVVRIPRKTTLNFFPNYLPNAELGSRSRDALKEGFCGCGPKMI